jgi:hypothetical protein
MYLRFHALKLFFASHPCNGLALASSQSFENSTLEIGALTVRSMLVRGLNRFATALKVEDRLDEDEVASCSVVFLKDGKLFSTAVNCGIFNEHLKIRQSHLNDLLALLSRQFFQEDLRPQPLVLSTHFLKTAVKSASIATKKEGNITAELDKSGSF